MNKQVCNQIQIICIVKLLNSEIEQLSREKPMKKNTSTCKQFYVHNNVIKLNRNKREKLLKDGKLKKSNSYYYLLIYYIIVNFSKKKQKNPKDLFFTSCQVPTENTYHSSFLSFDCFLSPG